MNAFAPRRILLPSDLSGAAKHARAWADLLAARDAKYASLFVHDAAPVPVLGLPVPPMSRSTRQALAARLRAILPDAEPEVRDGDPVSNILYHARRSDLIAMSTHGRKGLDRALFGSVSEAVARESLCPVLVTRTAPPKKPASVLAPVNLAPYSYKGLLLAARAAARLGARVTVLFVSPDKSRGPNPRFFLNGMLARLPQDLRAACRPELVIRAGDPVPEILAEARKHALVVLAAHRKSLLTDIVLGTTVERVLRHCPAPVLAAPSGR
jgi:nucleotide-binding universal stress UspA family protein